MSDYFGCAAPPASFQHTEFVPEQLVTAKGSTRVVVCIPARDEAATIAPIVSTIRHELMVPTKENGAGNGRLTAPLVDEILVVDDKSSDDTAAVAAGAGAVVVEGPGLGKGRRCALLVGEATSSSTSTAMCSTSALVT